MIVQNLSRSKNNINSFECWKYHDGKPWELCRRQVRITLIHISESGQLKVYLHHFLSSNKMTLTWPRILFPVRWMRGGSLCISPPRRTSHCPRRRRRWQRTRPRSPPFSTSRWSGGTSWGWTTPLPCCPLCASSGPPAKEILLRNWEKFKRYSRNMLSCKTKFPVLSSPQGWIFSQKF